MIIFESMNLIQDLYNVNLNNSKLRIYLIIFGFFLTLLTLSLIASGNYIFVIALWSPLVFAFIVIQPKLAVYQFLFLFFTNVAIIENPQILVVDISAFLLISSAFIDYLLKPNTKFQRPKLLNNFVFLIIAVSIAAIFGYEPILGLRPIAKLLYLAMIFLSVHRLSRYFEIKKLLILFVWFAVLFSLVAIWPYITGSSSARMFGFSKATLDDILMIAIPLGITLLLFSESRKGKWSLLGLLIMFVALLATQSRLSLFLTVIFSITTLYLVRQHIKKLNIYEHNNQNNSVTKNLIKRRIGRIIFALLFLFASILLIKPSIIYALWARFETLLVFASWDTIQLRFVLWRAAAVAFWDHPILGIGPGVFKILHEIYPELKFSYAYFIVQGFSAHNLILHYLAETGIVGGTAVIVLMIKQNLLGLKLLKNKSNRLTQDILISLFIITLILLVSSFFEAGWLWGQLSYMFVFFIALVVKANELTAN